MSFSDSIGRKVELDVFCPTELMETLIWNKFQLNRKADRAAAHLLQQTE